jgi:kinesin family protein 12
MGPRPSENVRVLVRVRPFVPREIDKGDEEVVRNVGERGIQVIDQKPVGRQQTATAYQFDQSFGSSTTQDEIFKQSGVLGLLDHVLEGYSATVFAYGPTGSGKTYTITGKPDSINKSGTGDPSDGVVIRSIEALFEKIRAQSTDGHQFKVCFYAEIHACPSPPGHLL